ALASTSVRNRLVCCLPSSPTYQPRHRLPTPCGLPWPSAHRPVASLVGAPSLLFFHRSITPPVPGVLLIGLVGFSAASASVSTESSLQSAYKQICGIVTNWLEHVHELVLCGAPSRTRTDTGRILSPLPLPIGLWGPGGECSALKPDPGRRVPPRFCRVSERASEPCFAYYPRAARHI